MLASFLSSSVMITVPPMYIQHLKNFVDHKLNVCVDFSPSDKQALFPLNVPAMPVALYDEPYH